MLIRSLENLEIRYKKQETRNKRQETRHKTQDISEVGSRVLETLNHLEFRDLRGSLSGKTFKSSDGQILSKASPCHFDDEGGEI